MIHDVELPVVRIRELADDPQFLSVVCSLYERLDGRIAAHQPVCRGRGTCCRFDDFGHRLYVTPVELAFFVGTVGTEAPLDSEATACPYQIDGLCQARASRPMGCRVFFCESAGRGWQERLAESTLAQLRMLHERFQVPYAYTDWFVALRQLA